MRFLFAFLVLIQGVSSTEVSRPDTQALFHQWKDSFDKDYESAEELSHRMQVWYENHSFIQQHNRKTSSYQLGHNEFSDMTWEEFRQAYRLGEHSRGILESDFPTVIEKNRAEPDVSMARRLKDLPESVDWAEAGAVTPVKNQGFCGSCWAFSAIGAIEGQRFLDTGELVDLSVQQLIDCDPMDRGCFGGLMDNAFLFDENSTGICSDVDYPYAMHKHWLKGCAVKQGLCDVLPHTKVSTFVDVNNQTNTPLMEAIAMQPVSVAIEADQQGFQFYKSGVFDADCGVKQDHGVLAVGYGTEDGTDYWLVKNSWGATWGDSGYIKLARDAPTEEGMCGILSFASRPILE